MVNLCRRRTASHSTVYVVFTSNALSTAYHATRSTFPRVGRMSWTNLLMICAVKANSLCLWLRHVKLSPSLRTLVRGFLGTFTRIELHHSSLHVKTLTVNSTQGSTNFCPLPQMLKRVLAVYSKCTSPSHLGERLALTKQSNFL